MLGQLLDKFAPQEPKITYAHREPGSHAQTQLALPAPPLPAQPDPASAQAAPADAATTTAKSQSDPEAGIFYIFVSFTSATADLFYGMYATTNS